MENTENLQQSPPSAESLVSKSITPNGIKMNHKHVSTYLNDHLAGASGAITLLQSLKAAYGNSSEAEVVSKILAEIESERESLKYYLEKLDVTESAVRKTTGWLSGKALELKLAIEDFKKGAFYLHEGLEALSVGIAGKHLLWMALGNLATAEPAFEGLDFGALSQQAISQRERLEPLRLKAAASALLEHLH